MLINYNNAEERAAHIYTGIPSTSFYILLQGRTRSGKERTWDWLTSTNKAGRAEVRIVQGLLYQVFALPVNRLVLVLVDLAASAYVVVVVLALLVLAVNLHRLLLDDLEYFLGSAKTPIVSQPKKHTDPMFIPVGDFRLV